MLKGAKMKWFYAREGKRIGPVSSSELRRLAAANEIQPNDLIWRHGLKTWIRASQVKGLLPGRVLEASPPPLATATSAEAIDSRARAKLGEFCLIKLLLLPIRLLAAFAGFFAFPIMMGVSGSLPRDWAEIDQFARVIMVLTGLGLAVTAWKVIGAVGDKLCEPR